MAPTAARRAKPVQRSSSQGLQGNPDACHPRRGVVGPSYGSFASGQARKLIPSAGPPLPTTTTPLGRRGGPIGRVPGGTPADGRPQVAPTDGAPSRRALRASGCGGKRADDIRPYIVGTSYGSLASPQAAKLVPSTAPPLPTTTTSLGRRGGPIGRTRWVGRFPIPGSEKQNSGYSAFRRIPAVFLFTSSPGR